MQAIRTRYHGPTNTKGSRISATCAGGRIYVPYNYALDGLGNHKAAALALMEKLDWVDTPYAGGVFEGDYYWSAYIEYPEELAHRELVVMVSSSPAMEAA